MRPLQQRPYDGANTYSLTLGAEFTISQNPKSPVIFKNRGLSKILIRLRTEKGRVLFIV